MLWCKTCLTLPGAYPRSWRLDNSKEDRSRKSRCRSYVAQTICLCNTNSDTISYRRMYSGCSLAKLHFIVFEFHSSSESEGGTENCEIVFVEGAFVEVCSLLIFNLSSAPLVQNFLEKCCELLPPQAGTRCRHAWVRGVTLGCTTQPPFGVEERLHQHRLLEVLTLHFSRRIPVRSGPGTPNFPSFWSSQSLSLVSESIVAEASFSISNLGRRGVPLRRRGRGGGLFGGHGCLPLHRQKYFDSWSTGQARKIFGGVSLMYIKREEK